MEPIEGKIEITVTHNDEGSDVNFSTNMTVIEMHYWLDHVRHLVVSGQLELSE